MKIKLQIIKMIQQNFLQNQSYSSQENLRC